MEEKGSQVPGTRGFNKRGRRIRVRPVRLSATGYPVLICPGRNPTMHLFAHFRCVLCVGACFCLVGTKNQFCLEEPVDFVNTFGA